MTTNKERAPELHAEVLLGSLCYRDDHISNTDIEEEVERWLRITFGGLIIGQHIKVNDDLRYKHLIQSIKISEFSGSVVLNPCHDLAQLALKVHAYRLRDSSESTVDQTSCGQGRDDGSAPGKMIELPNKSLSDVWASLKFENDEPDEILRSVARIIILLKQPGLDMNAMDLNRLILLHGPPGCGKTTLSRALAQKLSIRLGGQFPLGGRLFELNTQSLLSKYYSESGRLVTEVFDQISSLARDTGCTTLIFVLIDEVESIAGSREQLSASGECHDSIRVTNQLLTALDRIRTQPNVVVFCTSNLKSAIDPAFSDRVDFDVCVPSPCESAIYEIFRSTLNQLIRAGIVIPSLWQIDSMWQVNGIGSLYSKEDAAAHGMIPDWDSVIETMDQPDHPVQMLAALAQKCKGISGRKLKKLPLLSITKYTWGDNCPLDDALAAMKRAVEMDLHESEDRIMG